MNASYSDDGPKALSLQDGTSPTSAEDFKTPFSRYFCSKEYDSQRYASHKHAVEQCVEYRNVMDEVRVIIWQIGEGKLHEVLKRSDPIDLHNLFKWSSNYDYIFERYELTQEWLGLRKLDAYDGSRNFPPEGLPVFVDLIRTQNPALAARLEKVCRNSIPRDEYLGAFREWLERQEEMEKEKAQSALSHFADVSFSLENIQNDHGSIDVDLSREDDEGTGVTWYTLSIKCTGKGTRDPSAALRRVADKLDQLYPGLAMQKQSSPDVDSDPEKDYYIVDHEGGSFLGRK